MSRMIQTVPPETLRSWGVSPDAQIEYYDGKVLIIDDGAEDVGIGTMAKFGGSLIFGVAVFTHAPLVGATLFAYAGYKVLSTVGAMYGGNHDLASRIERDLGLDISDQPAASDEFENRFEDAVTTYRPGTQTRLGAIEVPASPAAQSAPSLNMSNESTKGFDWHRLNTDYNDFPHLFLLGKTGAGKSYVSDRLVRFLNGYCIVISPKKMPSDFQGLQVVGLPYDYHSIHRALVALEKLMVDREAEMQRTGFTDFQPINVILDGVEPR